MKTLSLILSLSLSLFLVACEDDEPSGPIGPEPECSATKPCTTADTVCDLQQGKCVPDSTGTCSKQCAANSVCTSTPGGETCICAGGWYDCNNDVTSMSGNGCECSHTCADINKCESDEPSPDGGLGCDTDCGNNTSCKNGTCSCLTGNYDCNNDIGQAGGDGCECKAECSGGVCPATTDCQSDVKDSCSNSGLWCDFGDCRACPAGQLNCDGLSACECKGTCNGTQCVGEQLCDYHDSSLCGSDPSLWCFENQCKACSSGWLNCDGGKGCECQGSSCGSCN